MIKREFYELILDGKIVLKIFNDEDIYFLSFFCVARIWTRMMLLFFGTWFSNLPWEELLQK